MISSITNGGKTHITYAHRHFPKIIELKCKKCKSKVIAKNLNASDEIEHFIDISNIEKTWNLLCVNCTYRKDLVWEELTEFDLWLKTEIRNINFWAWNTDHLKMIIKKLKKEDLASDKWMFFESYIPKIWLIKFNSNKEIRKLEKLIQK
ncbi:hypothetical protein [Olleya sp. YS]|uniref:hypothetical protein n=1 Tax=Olleya sp. YS TaxID=3028318 RepID=UPI0024341572|nr:hypothetical protein [Olleya sp. YS]WGD34635.1 hypothetical protein Ollyesu_12695 [Olleya sp. YS]